MQDWSKSLAWVTEIKSSLNTFCLLDGLCDPSSSFSQLQSGDFPPQLCSMLSLVFRCLAGEKAPLARRSGRQIFAIFIGFCSLENLATWRMLGHGSGYL